MGKSAVHFFVWAALMLMTGVRVLIHENVEAFDPLVLVKCFGDAFLMQTVIMELHSLGWPVHRRRRITILVHKSCVKQACPAWCPLFVSMFKRRCRARCHDFLISSKEEQDKEIEWAKSREGRGGAKAAPNDEALLTYPSLRSLANTNAWTRSLNVSEIRRLKHYMERWPLRAAYGLGQEVVGGCPTVAPNGTTLMTQIRKQGVVWVHSDLKRGMKHCMFC